MKIFKTAFTDFLKGKEQTFLSVQYIIQGVRGEFDPFCFRYISKLLQDIDIG